MKPPPRVAKSYEPDIAAKKAVEDAKKRIREKKKSQKVGEVEKANKTTRGSMPNLHKNLLRRGPFKQRGRKTKRSLIRSGEKDFP